MTNKERNRKLGMAAGIFLACMGITLIIMFAVMQLDLSRLSHGVIGYHDKTAGTLGNETAELELKSDYTDTLILLLMADLLSYALLFIGLYLLLSGTGQFNAEYRRIPTKKDIIERVEKLEELIDHMFDPGASWESTLKKLRKAKRKMGIKTKIGKIT